MNKKVLIIFGTRPEAIKMAPIIHTFSKNSFFDVKLCVTAQHREMLDQVLDFFEIAPDFDLNLMSPGQDLFDISINILCGLKKVLESFEPHYVLVHGDTTTSTLSALAAFYNRIPVFHVEAGLRTNNILSPFPEELNRQITARIAKFHFAPTSKAKQNLINENIEDEKIIITGNTVIDALMFSVKKVEKYKSNEIDELKLKIDLSKKIILVTGHRRENHGKGFLQICDALKKIAESNSNVQIIFPVHPNPNVLNIVYNELSDFENIKLIDPLSYPAFIWLMKESYLILTDSGGVQEEAPSLGKPVLVMRDDTERPEAVEAGTVILVGTDTNKIVYNCNELLSNNNLYIKMSTAHNPYGDGKASKRIVEFIEKI